MRLLSEKIVTAMILDEFIVGDPESNEQFIANDVATRIMKRIRELSVDVGEEML